MMRLHPALLSRSMDISSSHYTERKGTRLLRFLVLEETIDHLAKGGDGLGWAFNYLLKPVALLPRVFFIGP